MKDHINSFISKSVAIIFSFEVLHDFTPTQKRIKVKFTENGIRQTNLMNQGFNKSKEYIRDCAIIIRRGGGVAEKLELSSKNLDSTPLQNKKN